MSSIDVPLAPLAAYLSVRREAILNNWRTKCESSPSLSGVASLNREEFNNRTPFMLNILEQSFKNQALEGDIRQQAAEHGLHRWQKGYDLHELLEEMQHLNQLLLAELRAYWQLHGKDDTEQVTTSYERVAWFTQEIVTGSVEQYHRLLRLSASSRVETLQQTLESLSELTRQRGEILRESSHDLRSAFGIIRGSASFLSLIEEPAPEVRKQMVDMLNRNLASAQRMVVQLMDLARLEAGQDPVNLSSFDASALLQEQIASYQGLAGERGITLLAEGPDQLVVDGDAIKLQRIVQNLVLNALEHTVSGWVSVSWSREGNHRWILSIQDSGPGLPGAQAPALSPYGETSSAFGFPLPPEPEPAANSDIGLKGEGIGLSIVKRLCELLRAGLEIESQPGVGTLFRMRFLIHWPGQA
jgi:signal transduction histidine kinase